MAQEPNGARRMPGTDYNFSACDVEPLEEPNTAPEDIEEQLRRFEGEGGSCKEQ